MADIYLAFLEKAVVEQGKEGKVVHLYLPAEPETTETPITQPHTLWLEYARNLRQEGIAEISIPEYRVTTPSAGAISVFYQDDKPTHVSFSQKDPDALRDPGFRVPRNGYPRSPENWVSMGHLVEEAFEEGIFLTRNGELVLAEDENFDSIIKSVADRIVTQSGLNIRGTRRVPIRFVGMQDTLNIYNKDGILVHTYRGAFSFTPETGYNLIQEMRVDYPAEELVLVDGETLPNGNVIGRDTCLLKIGELKGKRFGDPIKERVYRQARYDDKKLTGRVEEFERDDRFYTDKVPRSFLCQLRDADGEPVYPIEWMAETEQLFSNPHVLGSWMKRLRDVSKKKPDETPGKHLERILAYINGNIWSALEREAFEKGLLR